MISVCNDYTHDEKALKWVLKTVQHITGTQLPSIQDIYNRQFMSKAQRFFSNWRLFFPCFLLAGFTGAFLLSTDWSASQGIWNDIIWTYIQFKRFSIFFQNSFIASNPLRIVEYREISQRIILPNGRGFKIYLLRYTKEIVS